MRASAAETASGVVGLVTKAEGPPREAMLTIFVERDDLNRNMARQRILLKLTENGPAEHVGQKDVERDRGRLKLLGEHQRIGAAHGHDRLEARSLAPSRP